MKITSTTTIKRIFLFFVFYLPFQYMIVGIAGVLDSEPWPAFVLPGFKSVYATQDHVEMTEPRFTALAPANTVVEVDVHQLFKGLPTSKMQGFLKSNFSNQTEYSSEAKEWLEHRLGKLYPRKKFSALKVEWIQIIYDQQGDSVRIIDKVRLKSVTIPFTNK
jgi:hypothetical protein